jgi:cytochrome c-type biogenesis protein CcmH
MIECPIFGTTRNLLVQPISNLPSRFQCARGEKQFFKKRKPKMAGNEASQSQLPRLLLIGGAAIALISVGYRVFQDRASAPVPPTAPATAAQDINSTIRDMEARLQKEPNNAEGWRMLGIGFSQNGQFAEAAQALSRSTRLDPKNAGGWAELGAALMQGGDGTMPAEAMAAFDKAIALEPREPLARYFRGVGKDIRGDHKGAIDDWFDMLAHAPADAPWRDHYRQVIEGVAKQYSIDIAARMKSLPGGQPGRGEALATGGIPGPSKSEMQQAAQMPKGQQDAMVQNMVEGLAAKLKANPKNLEGWIMMLRSRVTLGETAKAAQALKDARTAFAGDAAALAQINEAAGALGIGS